ncbi:MAG: cobyric acid synthase [Nitrospirales bacterium]|nr:cobyric acid synthase [Nitrospirales bacterium]
MTKSLMIQGTGSGAGKSLMVAALCRIFRDMGLSVAPFKAQNMALNSHITADGGEIGRAQALQAEAAGIEATVDMNPVLLKVAGERGCQVIIHGKVRSHMTAREYYQHRESAWEAVKESYKRLSSKHDIIVIEGAGSPAEINLSDVEIVNMSVARLAKAPVLLVGDIDKGGVFASLYGTVKLLGRDSRWIKGYIINKFRGDIAILQPGLDMIRAKTGRPVIGVVPYVRTGLPEEDGLSLMHDTGMGQQGGKELRVVVVRHPRISNFTDLDPFLIEPDVELVYSQNPADIEQADMVIIPGTKTTVDDLLFLREKGLEAAITRAHSKGIPVIGICGGYQMLGHVIHDPLGIESSHRELKGLGLLDIETTFGETKTTCQVEAKITEGSRVRGQGSRNSLTESCFFPDWTLDPGPWTLLKGYEIHMGTSTGDIGLFRIKRLPDQTAVPDGSVKGTCWGTYIHGIFDNDGLRRAVLNHSRIKKGLAPIETTISFQETKEKAIDRMADLLRENLDMAFIKGLVRL